MISPVSAIIPVRAYDAVLPRKNILSFAGTTLLQHKINQLLPINQISEIIISSDSNQILRLVGNHPKLKLDKRPDRLCSLDSDFSELVCYLADLASADHVLWAPVTAPLVLQHHFANAIECYFQALQTGCDSLITVEKIRRYLLDENGPLNFRFRPSARDENKLPILYHYINAINLAPRQKMIAWKYNWGLNPYKLVLPPAVAIDICTDHDYKLAQYLYKEG